MLHQLQNLCNLVQINVLVLKLLFMSWQIYLLDTDVVFLIGTENPFNSVNRKVLSHNLKFICPIIATCIINCYANPSRLFIVCGGEINSSVGPTQGDLTSIGAYTLVILPLIIKSIKDYWDKLTAIGPKYGYVSKSTKSLLIVKEINFMEAQNL